MIKTKEQFEKYAAEHNLCTEHIEVRHIGRTLVAFGFKTMADVLQFAEETGGAVITIYDFDGSTHRHNEDDEWHRAFDEEKGYDQSWLYEENEHATCYTSDTFKSKEEFIESGMGYDEDSESGYNEALWDKISALKEDEMLVECGDDLSVENRYRTYLYDDHVCRDTFYIAVAYTDDEVARDLADIRNLPF